VPTNPYWEKSPNNKESNDDSEESDSSAGGSGGEELIHVKEAIMPEKDLRISKN